MLNKYYTNYGTIDTPNGNKWKKIKYTRDQPFQKVRTIRRKYHYFLKTLKNIELIVGFRIKNYKKPTYTYFLSVRLAQPNSITFGSSKQSSQSNGTQITFIFKNAPKLT
jgi:hypothetical protein